MTHKNHDCCFQAIIPYDIENHNKIEGSMGFKKILPAPTKFSQNPNKS